MFPNANLSLIPPLFPGIRIFVRPGVHCDRAALALLRCPPDASLASPPSARAPLLLPPIRPSPPPCQVLLEIQDTLKQPPPPARTMKSAINVAVTGAAAFYISVACTGCAGGRSQLLWRGFHGWHEALVEGPTKIELLSKCCSYAALGDQTADEVLNGFPSASCRGAGAHVSFTAAAKAA